MIRRAILLLLCIGLLFVISPFLISSLLVDQRGVIISGHVHSKEERVVVHEASWTRSRDVVVQYEPPDRSGVAFLRANVSPERFDELKKGDLVDLRYLRKEDMPDVPGANALRQMHLLPTARMADQRTWSGFELTFGTTSPIAVKLVAGGIMILILWRMARIPLFGWAVGACILCALVVMFVHDFPTPTPAPQRDIRVASGVVKSLERVEWLFRSTHERGFKADQPIEVVGVELVPEGRTESVLAVDLIDAGSVPGLEEHAPVSIEYERDAPRTAHIRNAGRRFVRRNLEGIATELVASLVLIVVLLLVAKLFGRGYRRLTQRNATAR